MPRDHDSPSRHADRDNSRDDAPSSRHHQRRDDDPWRGRSSDLHGHRHDDHRHDRRERDDAAKRDRWLDDADLDAIGVGAPPAGSVGQWLGARASPMEVTSPHQWTATMTVTTRFLPPPSAASRRPPPRAAVATASFILRPSRARALLCSNVASISNRGRACDEGPFISRPTPRGVACRAAAASPLDTTRPS